MTPKTLKHRALKAQVAGESWDAFWTRYGDDVRQVEPHDVDRFHKLERRLHHMVTVGDGEFWCRGTPWLEDDRAAKESAEV